MSINNDLTEEEYRIKYLKYKEKYVTLKNQSGSAVFKCKTAARQANWVTAPCSECTGTNYLDCCRGFVKAGKGTSAFKSIGRKKQLCNEDEICKCGHPASYHYADAVMGENLNKKSLPTIFKAIQANRSLKINFEPRTGAPLLIPITDSNKAYAEALKSAQITIKTSEDEGGD